MDKAHGHGREVVREGGHVDARRVPTRAVLAEPLRGGTGHVVVRPSPETDTDHAVGGSLEPARDTQ